MRSMLARLVVGFVIVLVLGACAAPSVTSVSIDGGDRTIVVGDPLTLTATVVSSGGAGGSVAWESSDVAVAVIDGAGNVTSFTAGTTEVTATSTSDPSMSDTITLTVDPPGLLRWTRQFGTSEEDFATGVATDADGNVYAVGATFGDLEGANAGFFDAFVRSYRDDGTLRWTRQFGTTSDGRATGVATDASGNVYVVGYTFLALEGESAGGVDAFVRSFDRDGTVRWTRQFGTNATDEALGVATDASGNVYVVGRTLGVLEGDGFGGVDAFVRSFDGDGTVRWTRQFGTNATDEALGVATDASGNVYVAGYTGGALEGDSAGGFDAFVRSFDGDGTVRWTRQFGTSGGDSASGVATDASGNVYVAGRTGGALEGPNAGFFDAFVRSFAGDGTVRWTRQFGTSSDDSASGVATDASGNVYVAGSTGGALEGPAAASTDAFVRSFAGDGTVRWTRQFGTSGSDRAAGVATDVSGGVYVAGLTFGALEGESFGGWDAFIRTYGR